MEPNPSRQASLLVFGHSGQLAKALVKPARHAGFIVHTAGHTTADLTQPGQARALIAQVNPTHVINAAAYTAVDQAETEVETSFALNAQAPDEMAQTCAESGIRFVHVSTDYVFDGKAQTPYAEDAIPAPLNTYGRSKLDGERKIQQANPQAAIVRTSAVFSGGGDDFPSKIWAAAQSRDTLNVVSDQITGPTSAWALAEHLIALALTEASGMFHCAGQPFVSWSEYARLALSVSAANGGPHADVISTHTQQNPDRAQRPMAGRLGGNRLQNATGLFAPDWRADLAIALDAWMSNR